jgi:hypothetical protein
MIYKMTDDESEVESNKNDTNLNSLALQNSKLNIENEYTVANNVTSNSNSTSINEDIYEYQVIPLEFSEDNERLSSLAYRLISYFTNEIKGNLDDSVHVYENLNELTSGEPLKKLDGRIQATFAITVHNPIDSMKFKVQTPPTESKLADLNNNSSSMNDMNSFEPTTVPKDLKIVNQNVKLENWMNSIEKLINKNSNRSLPVGLDVNEINGVSLGHTSLKLNDKCKETDENILRMRNTLFNLINTILKNTIISPLKLSKFRETMIDKLNQIKHRPLEDFTIEMFQFFNQHVFLGLLESVKVEWSDRFRT